METTELTIKMYDFETTCTIPEEDSTANDLLSAFCGMLVSQGFSVTQIRNALTYTLNNGFKTDDD